MSVQVSVTFSMCSWQVGGVTVSHPFDAALVLIIRSMQEKSMSNVFGLTWRFTSPGGGGGGGA